jgi:hypothetical protein
VSANNQQAHDWGANPEGWEQGLSEEEVQIAYDLSLRGLERQPAILADLRTRATALVAAAGVVATLFAPKAFGSNISHGAMIAYIAGGGATVLCFAMCWPIFRSIHDDGYDDVQKYAELRDGGKWPNADDLAGCRRKWRSTINLSAVTRLHQITASKPLPIELASFIAICRGRNWAQINARNTWFQFAGFWFAVEVICGILGLAFR